uniref:hypothetical protein n=1 Tax=Pseudomonas viridiflava TaxID=33069 RepID=UPI001981C9EB
AIDGLFNAAAKGVLLVGRSTAAYQAVLAVIAVFSDKLFYGIYLALAGFRPAGGQRRHAGAR